MEELASFKIDILCQLNKIKNVEVSNKTPMKEPLSIFCPRCYQKHALHECPMDKTTICSIYELGHTTDECAYLPIAKTSMVNSILDLNYINSIPLGNSRFGNMYTPWKYQQPMNSS